MCLCACVHKSLCDVDELPCVSYLMNHTVIDCNEFNCFEYPALGDRLDGRLKTKEASIKCHSRIMSLLIFKAATVSFFILYLTQFPIKKEQNMSEPSDINSWWPRQDARTEKWWKWQEFEWEGQRRMSQGHVQCVYVYEWGRGDGLDVWTRRQHVVDCLPPAREFEAMRWANVSRERERVSESGRERVREEVKCHVPLLPNN